MYSIAVTFVLIPIVFRIFFSFLKVSIVETILGDPSMEDLRLVVLVLKSLNDPTLQYSVSNILTISIYDPQYPT
jgi:hypothetical protein